MCWSHANFDHTRWCYLKEPSVWFRASYWLPSGHASALCSPPTSEFPTSTFYSLLCFQATFDSPHMSAEILWPLSPRSLRSMYFPASLTRSWYVSWVLWWNRKPSWTWAVSLTVSVPAVRLHGDLCGSCAAENCCLCQHDLLLRLLSGGGSCSHVCCPDGFIR